MQRIRIDIRTKAILFAGYMSMTFFFNDPRYMAGLFFMACAVAFLVRLPWDKVVKFVLPLLPLVLLILVCTGLNINHTGGGLALGITYAVRILIFMLASMIVQQNTSQTDLLQLFQWLKFPGEISFLFLTALRFIPALNKKRLQITEAQTARGSTSHTGGFFHSIRSFVPIVIPLFASSIQMANTLSISMVSRGFGYGKTWTPDYKLTFKALDIILLLVAAAVFLLAVYVRFVEKRGCL
ncbi:MAG: energy-coupling factor transporter transmembrane protein EcfT [Peptococcaceae bacterium]|nr:energy-coupling factor transporter transmembrane protein EcfT [Peptococcaceae bacterium]